MLRRIYSNTALITVPGRAKLATSSSSHPGLMAQMLMLLDVKPGHRVLEIGAGTGYNAALMSEIAGTSGRIATIDSSREVAEAARVHLAGAGYADAIVRAGDGWYGCADLGPFDRIVATVGCPDISPHWLEQLKPDGKMVVPLDHGDAHPLYAVTMAAGAPAARVVGWSGFIPMNGYASIRPPAWTEGVSQELPRASHSLPDDISALEARRYPQPNDWHDCHFYTTLEAPGEAVMSEFGFGMRDEAGNLAALGPGEREITSWGNPVIAQRLISIIRRWSDHRRPRAADFECRFVPHVQAAEFPGYPWRMKRVAHTELIRLPR
jgi:protein-L-isoaspartate(D-aspartate) O-methyltransferase